MKKGFLAFGVALTTLGFISCGGNAEQEEGYTQEQLDSILQWEEDSAAAALQLIEDSLLLEEAKLEGTSATQSGTKKPSAGTTTKPSTSQDQVKHDDAPEVAPKPGGLRGKSDQTKQQEAEEGRGGLRSKSDQAKQQEAEEGRGGLRSKSDQAKKEGNN